jgi:glycosyltransferase involved in cell wall biosynthesis
VTAAPVVSVIIPTRNRAHLLRDCLVSILSQSSSVPFEVVVADNASDDETPRMLRDWSAKEPRLRSIHEKELGRSAALVTGMRTARGSILVFTDDDVLVSPDWIESYAVFFERHPGSVLAGGPIHPAPLDGRWPKWFSTVAAMALGGVTHDSERVLTPLEWVWGANMAARSELFERSGGWARDLGVRDQRRPAAMEPDRYEDTEMQQRVRALGGEVWFCPGASLRHRSAVPGPRECLARGFANGRNAYRRPPAPGVPTDRKRAPRSLHAGLALMGTLARLVGWCVVLRIRTTRPPFERAWLAAWRSGWRMEDLLSDGVHDRLDRVVRSVTRRWTRLAYRIAPASG